MGERSKARSARCVSAGAAAVLTAIATLPACDQKNAYVPPPPLCPDRARATDRPLRQERDSDRRGRARSAPDGGGEANRGGGRGGAGAVQADTDDLPRFYLRHGAACCCDRCRGERTQIDWDHGLQRHARLNLPCGTVRPVLFRRDPEPRGTNSPEQAKSWG